MAEDDPPGQVLSGLGDRRAEHGERGAAAAERVGRQRRGQRGQESDQEDEPSAHQRGNHIANGGARRSPSAAPYQRSPVVMLPPDR